MSRISARFEALKAVGKKALIPYVTAGDPEPAVTVPLMHKMVAAGADIIELGVPFSDPMAEGPVIQKAMERALAHDVTLTEVLGMVKTFRQQDNATPVLLMGYLNPIEVMGYTTFARSASEAGVDGALIVDLPPEEAEEKAEESPTIRVAFVGKPNAGKSSLLNRLVGSERALVHDQPGTTTDPVDCEIELGGNRFTLVDTAGVRRRAKVSRGSGTPVLDSQQEKIAVSLALGQIRRADVVVLLIDGSLGPSEQDAKLVNMAIEAGRALVVALNKSDLISSSAAAKELREKSSDDLRFVKFAPTVMISALRGDGVGKLMDAVVRVSEEHGKRIPTSALNDFFAEVLETHPPPIHRGKAVTIRYLTQGGVRPPTFLLFANRKEGLSESYKRYIVNQLRVRYQFEGTPLRLIIKAKSKTGRRAKARR